MAFYAYFNKSFTFESEILMFSTHLFSRIGGLIRDLLEKKVENNF